MSSPLLPCAYIAMPTSSPPRRLAPAAVRAHEDDASIAEVARELQRARDTGRWQRPLRGRHIGVLCRDIDSEDAALLREAATALGASVSHVTADLTHPASSREFAETARMLGRLYDALECQGLPREVMKRLAHEACVPCFDVMDAQSRRVGVSTGPPLADATPREARKYLLQAALLRRMAG